MSTIPDVYVLCQTLQGKNLLIECPSSIMKEEFDELYDMYQDLDNESIRSEMYRRLQVRVTSIIISVFSQYGDDVITDIHPRDYFSVYKGEIISEQGISSRIPILHAHVFHKYLEVVLLSNKTELENHYIYYNMKLTIPKNWNSMSEAEKEEEWKEQIDNKLYDFYHV